ncbi:hypothetical protein CDD82_5232 [Ophiocordyceps australis]|uniref:Uncharacterized protein n=1 Tax=Ophiocordyceps australis TaxID=1399860 RepID=A0A2C5YWD7_9HYPO|nr:hypothetical protein CDD82_5232 [Ophiocordyceps australis]
MSWCEGVPTREEREDPFADEMSLDEQDMAPARPNTPILDSATLQKPQPQEPVVLERPVRLHFLFVGSRGAGQTSLLFRTRFGDFPDVGGLQRLTSGVPDLNAIERLGYIAWHGVFLCFDVSNRIGMVTIAQWWLHAQQRGFTTQTQSFRPLVYLVGTKKDLRQRGDCALGGGCRGVACGQCLVKAVAHGHRIGAEAYVECSAKTGENVDLVIDGASQRATRDQVERQKQTARPCKRKRGE